MWVGGIDIHPGVVVVRGDAMKMMKQQPPFRRASCRAGQSRGWCGACCVGEPHAFPTPPAARLRRNHASLHTYLISSADVDVDVVPGGRGDMSIILRAGKDVHHIGRGAFEMKPTGCCTNPANSAFDNMRCCCEGMGSNPPTSGTSSCDRERDEHGGTRVHGEGGKLLSLTPAPCPLQLDMTSVLYYDRDSTMDDSTHRLAEPVAYQDPLGRLLRAPVSDPNDMPAIRLDCPAGATAIHAIPLPHTLHSVVSGIVEPKGSPFDDAILPF